MPRLQAAPPGICNTRAAVRWTSVSRLGLFTSDSLLASSPALHGHQILRLLSPERRGLINRTI